MPPPALNALFAEVEVYDRLKDTLLERLDYFRQALELRPVESVDVYEKCILECIRLGWDDEAWKCAGLLANVINTSSRYKKLALAWRLRNRHDVCLVLLSKHLTDFFCDFPMCTALLDQNRLLRFRYTMWDQGDIYVFGDNRNRILGVKADFVPKERPMLLKLPTTLACMGSSNVHTIFQGINGDFYGCGATKNFMLCPKTENEVLDEPTKIALKFEPTDPVKNFYVSDHGTLIFTERYLYLIGRKVDPKKTGKKWTSAFPEKWFSHCGKGNQMAKNLTRFTLDLEKYDRREFVRMMPFNGSYMSKDNHAYVDFKGTPIKVTINEKNCYYQLEGDKAMRIINYVVLGTETKMGTGPDAIYPSGKCVTMDPGQSLLIGQLRWAKKANCTDDNDVTQYTLLAYMDECRGSFFMERFVVSPDGRGYLFQVGRAEKRPFYTLKPSIREAARIRMHHTFVDYMCPHSKAIPKELSYMNVTEVVDHLEAEVKDEWFEEDITQEHRHIHLIGFLAFALSPRTRLMKCHQRCSRLCWRHPLPSHATDYRTPFRDVLRMPRIVDFDTDLTDPYYTRPEDLMSDRVKLLMNEYDDNLTRCTTIWHSPETRNVVEAAKVFNEMEVNFYRSKDLPPETTDLGPKVAAKSVKKHIEYIREQVKFLAEHQCYFTEAQNRANKRMLFSLIAIGITWGSEYTTRKTKGWITPKQTSIYPHYKTRNPQTIVLRRIRSGLLKPDTVLLDVNVRFHYRIKGLRAPHDDTQAKMNIHTNKVLLSMLNPSLNEHIQHNVLSLNSLLETFENMWTVTLEYPMTVFFFLQHFRQSPVTVNEACVPRELLAKYGFKLVLEKHAADCPDRMFGVTWHYATLKYKHHREDTDIIAPIDIFGKADIWEINCRGKKLQCHKYLLQIYSKHPELSNRDDPKKKKFSVDEDYDVVLAALRMLSDMNTIERYSWEKRVKICRFYGRYLFPEALEDALAAVTLLMTENDARYIRPLIAEYPAIMERHIGTLRPSVVITWSDELFPEPKAIHMARIIEHWPEKGYGHERITKTSLDPTYCRLLRTDEQWKREFFTDPEKDVQPDIQQMLREDMFSKSTFSYEDKPEADEI